MGFRVFNHRVVVHRRDVAINGWRNWLREDPLLHPCKWLRPDFVPPAPFLQCEPHITPGGSGVLADPARIVEEFRKAWLPYFCRSGETSLEPAPSKCVLMRTSRAVRSDMRGWVVTDEGDRWSVKLDVRDLGGPLSTTFRGWSATLAAWVRLVIARLVLIFVLPLDFHGRLRVIKTMFIPGALRGIEVSFLADSSLRKLRAAVFRVVWSGRRCLVCWMGLRGVIMLSVLFGSGFVGFVGTLQMGPRRFLGCIG